MKILTLVGSVNAPCNTDNECGANKKCTQKFCACDGDKKSEDIIDDYGRTVQRCITINGMFLFFSQKNLEILF